MINRRVVIVGQGENAQSSTARLRLRRRCANRVARVAEVLKSAKRTSA